MGGLEASLTEEVLGEYDKRAKGFQKSADETKKAHEELVASLKGDTKELAESTADLLAAISEVERSGSVNQEVAGKVQDSIQKQIDSYAEFGIAVPEQLQKVADKWGVISTAQEKAMEEQKKRVEELKKEIQSLDDELTALEAKLAGSQKDIFGNLIGSGGEIQKLRDEIRKIETQPGWISVEDIQRADQLREKIREIERARTSAPSGNDPQTLADLDKLAELQGKRNDLENELIGTEGDLIRQQESLARSTDNLSDSAAGAGDSFAGASGGLEDWLDQIGDAADQMGDARTRADRLAREVEDSGEAAGEAAEGFDDAGESVRDFGGAADEATESLRDAADAAAEVGDEAEKASDKAEEAFSGLGSGAKELNDVLPITYGWLVKIEAKAREIAAIEL